MNYKLAKELKDAGFPIGFYEDDSTKWYLTKDYIIKGGQHLRKISYDFRTWKISPVIDYSKELVYVPTLLELIEACGDKISHIKRLENGSWFAVSHNAFYDDGCNNIEECGDTPEEAVARLWLELNKK